MTGLVGGLNPSCVRLLWSLAASIRVDTSACSIYEDRAEADDTATLKARVTELTGDDNCFPAASRPSAGRSTNQRPATAQAPPARPRPPQVRADKPAKRKRVDCTSVHSTPLLNRETRRTVGPDSPRISAAEAGNVLIEAFPVLFQLIVIRPAQRPAPRIPIRLTRPAWRGARPPARVLSICPSASNPGREFQQPTCACVCVSVDG